MYFAVDRSIDFMNMPGTAGKNSIPADVPTAAAVD
jgi:hypothetical protein